MNLYKECLGGEHSFKVVGESSLKTNDLEMMATDMKPESLNEGNAVHLCLVCKTEEETRACLINFQQEVK